MSRFAIIAVVLVSALAWAPITGATIEGPCSASIAGEDVANRGTSATSDAITVAEDATVPVSMSASSPIDRLKVQIEFAGLRWTVHDRPTTGRSWSSDVAVDDYATYGVGLYKVIGSSSGQGLSCSGAALIEVEGSPLTTVAGLVALGLALVGGLGVLLGLRGRGSGGRMILGTVFGLMLGAGVGVLLQQFALVYPTPVVVIVLLAGGAVLGLALSGLRRFFASA